MANFSCERLFLAVFVYLTISFSVNVEKFSYKYFRLCKSTSLAQQNFDQLKLILFVQTLIEWELWNFVSFKKNFFFLQLTILLQLISGYITRRMSFGLMMSPSIDFNAICNINCEEKLI